MRILLLLLTLILLTSCDSASSKESPMKDSKYSINCEEASLVACLAAERFGYATRIELQKTPDSNKGIYHAQCQVLINNKWKYITLDRWPFIVIDSHREFQEGIEYLTIDQMYEIARR